MDYKGKYSLNYLDEKSSLAVVDNGGGDTMHILFSKDGCIIKFA